MSILRTRRLCHNQWFIRKPTHRLVIFDSSSNYLIASIHIYPNFHQIKGNLFHAHCNIAASKPLFRLEIEHFISNGILIRHRVQQDDERETNGIYPHIHTREWEWVQLEKVISKPSSTMQILALKWWEMMTKSSILNYKQKVHKLRTIDTRKCIQICSYIL